MRISQISFYMVLIVIIGLVIAISANQNYSRADVYVMGNNVQVQSFPPPKIINPTGCQVVNVNDHTVPAPVSECSIQDSHFQNYIKKPYHDPNLAKETLEADRAAAITAQGTDLQEYHNNMEQICANFYSARRARNFDNYNRSVTTRQTFDRNIMSFQKFAESCENYIQNNKTIRTGVRSTMVGDTNSPNESRVGENEIPVNDFGTPVGETSYPNY